MKDYNLTAPNARLNVLLRILAVAGLVCILVNVSYLWWQHNHQTTQLTAQPAPLPPPVLTANLAASNQAAPQEQWLLLHPGDVPLRLQLARFYFLNKQFAAAIKHLLVAKTQNPRDAQLLLRLSMAYKENNQLPEALTSIQQALKLTPKSIRLQQWLGEVYLAQGRSEDALRIFDQCLQQDPKSYAAWMGKGRAVEQLYLAKKGVATPDIVKPVEQAVKLQPDNAEGLIILARMKFTYLADLDEAAKLARRAMTLNPDLVESYLLLAQLDLKMPTPAHLDEAESLARQAAQRDPVHPGPLYTLARAQMQKGKTREAIASLEQSMRVQALPEAIYMLSQAYARSGDLVKAQQYSVVYREWNDFMEQRKTLLGEFQHNPQDISIYCRLAELYLSRGSYEPATNWLLKAQQLRQNDPRVRQLLQEVARQKQHARKQVASTP